MELNFNHPITLQNLKEWCIEHAYDIALPWILFDSMYTGTPIENIKVRYVIDEDKFGYAHMGDFFFIDDCMYVVSDDESFKAIDNSDIPELYKSFYGCDWQKDEKYCTRVIFAGIATPFEDELGDTVYTGDIVKLHFFIEDECIKRSRGGKTRPIIKPEYLKKEGTEIIGCVSPVIEGLWDCREKGEPPVYGIIMDNACARLSTSRKIERLGTSLFGLNRNDTEVDLTIPLPIQDDELVAAQFTPSFEQEAWKYTVLKEIGAVYNWRK